MKCYPTRTNPIVLTKAAGVWPDFTDKIEIIPVNTIANQFMITGINICEISDIGNFEIALFSGEIGSEESVINIPFERTANLSQEGIFSFGYSNIISANTRISAALSGNNAAQDTADIKLIYEET